MSKFKIKVTFEDKPIIEAKLERITDFNPTFKELKKKFK